MAERSARKKESDILYNARRRMMRQAARAEKAGDIRQAMELRAKAESFKASAFAKGMKRNSVEYAEAVKTAGQTATTTSVGLTKSRISREKQARAILRGSVASQFLAATVELWHKPGEKIPAAERFNRIISGLGARDLLDAVRIMEEGTGREFSSMAAELTGEEKYDTLTVRLGMLFVSDL